MRKRTLNSTRGSGRGKFLAISSLALTLAAFGCSTNQYPGNGQPSPNPMYGPVSHAVTPGSSSGTEGTPPPMASSFTTSTHVNLDAVAAHVMAADYGGRVLGVSGAEGVQTGPLMEPTGGQYINPAPYVNPQVTVNSSVSSPATPAVGVAGGGGGADAAALFVAPSATAPATIGSPSLAVTGAIGVGAAPASGAVVPATTAFSPTVSGAPIATPMMAQGRVFGTGQAVIAPATIGSPSLAATGAVGVGAAPPAGAVVPSTAAFSPTLTAGAAAPAMVRSGATPSNPVTLNPPMASASAPIVLSNGMGATSAAVTIGQRTRAASAIRLTAANPVHIVTGTSGKITITNVKH